MKATAKTYAERMNIAVAATLIRQYLPKAGSRLAFAYANELLKCGELPVAAAWMGYARAIFELEMLDLSLGP